MADNKVKIKITADSSKARAELERATDSLDELEQEARQAGDALGALGKGAIGTVLFNEISEAAERLSRVVEAVTDLSDAYRQLQSRIENSTGSQQEANRLMGELEQIALATHAPLQNVAELYARLRDNIEETAASNDQLLRFTEAVGNAMRVSGTSAREASGALLQLSQALASGVLRGDEFNSVNEQMPAIMEAVAKSLDVSRGKLRALAEQGELTADVVLNAVLSMSDEWRQAATSMPVTLKQAITDLETAWQSYLGKSEGVGAATELLTDAIGLLADNLGGLVNLAGDAALATLPALFVKIAQSTTAGIIKLGEYAAAQRDAASAAQTAATREVASAKEAALANEILAKARLHEAQTAVAVKSAALQRAQAAEMEARATLEAANTVTLGGRQRAAIERDVTQAINTRVAAENELALAQARATSAQRAHNQAAMAGAVAQAENVGALGRLKGGLTGLLNPMRLLNAGMNTFISWEVGKAIGEWLRGFKLVRKGAVGLLATVLSLKNGVLLLSEAFAALFTDDSVSAAMDRFHQRMDALRENIGGMLDDIDAGIDIQDEAATTAGRLAEKTNQAADATERLGAAQADAARQASTLTDRQAYSVSVYNKMISSATTAEQVTAALTKATRSQALTTEALGIVSQVAAQKMRELSETMEPVSAASGAAAASYLTMIQNARSLGEVTTATASAMKALAGDTRAQALVSEAAARKASEFAAAQDDLREKSIQVTNSLSDNYAQMLKVAESYRQGSISAKEYNSLIRELADQNKAIRDAQREAADATHAQANASSEVATATRESNHAMTSAISLTHVVRNNYYALSESVGRYFDEQMKAVRSVEAWWDVLSDRHFEQVKARYDEMVAANDRLIERLRSGVASAEDLRQAQSALAGAAINAAHGVIGLGEQELAPLRSALADAQSRLESLRESAQSTLVSLQNELDRMNGNLDSIEQRNYEQKRLELQEKLAEAQAAGDAQAIAALQKSLEILKQIHQVKLQNLQADKHTVMALGSGGATQGGSTTTAAQSTTPPVRGSVSGGFASRESRHVVELRDGRGNTTDIEVMDDEQATRFLDALKNARLVAS